MLKLRKSIAIIMSLTVLFTFMPQMAETASAASKPKKVKSVTTTSVDGNKIKISWGKTSKAKKYKIYRKEGNKKYKPIATVKKSKRSYTDKKVKTGVTYTYKVRALNGKKAGSYSSSKKAYLPKQLSKPIATADNDDDEWTVTLSYKKVSGASGYQIVRADNKAFKDYNIDYYDYTTATTYVDESVDANQTYYYKVRAYKTFSGKRYYGKYSSVVSATTKVSETEDGDKEDTGDKETDPGDTPSEEKTYTVTLINATDENKGKTKFDVAENEYVDVKADAFSGKAFHEWKVEGITFGENYTHSYDVWLTSFTMKMPPHDVTIEATYIDGPVDDTENSKYDLCKYFCNMSPYNDVYNHYVENLKKKGLEIDTPYEEGKHIEYQKLQTIMETMKEMIGISEKGSQMGTITGFANDYYGVQSEGKTYFMECTTIASTANLLAQCSGIESFLLKDGSHYASVMKVDGRWTWADVFMFLEPNPSFNSPKLLPETTPLAVAVKESSQNISTWFSLGKVFEACDTYDYVLTSSKENDIYMYLYDNLGLGRIPSGGARLVAEDATYTSSDESVLSFDNDAKTFTAKKAGTVDVTIVYPGKTLVSGVERAGYTTTIAVTVTE